MELSTSTNICAFTPTRQRLPVEFCMETCANAGYRVLDMNFCIAMNPDSPLRSNDWESYVLHLQRLAKKLGVRFSQAHLPYYDVDKYRGTEQGRLMEELIRRCIIATGMLEIPWTVTHPFTVYQQAEDPAACQQANLEYFIPHVENARRNGVGIALETDFDLPDQRIYCSSMPELTALVDAFQDPAHVGLCYDFGHANLMKDGLTHRQRLNLAGKRLKAVHVQDNHGWGDEHLLPFFGSIDWEDAMAGLADIDYQGDLTFEVQEFGRCLPREMKHLTVELSLAVGEKLMKMVEKAKK